MDDFCTMQQLRQEMERSKTLQSQLTDAKNRECQIRKMAKKFKDSYYTLKRQSDELQADMALETAYQLKKSEDLSEQLQLRQREIELLRKEMEILLKHQDDNKNLLADANFTIATLTETNRQIMREHQVCKEQLQTLEQSRAEHDSALASTTTQLDSRIIELLEQEMMRHETIAQLTQLSATLHRVVDVQEPQHMPATSSVVTVSPMGSTGVQKRLRDAEADSWSGVEEFVSSETSQPQDKRKRIIEQTFEGIGEESRLDVVSPLQRKNK